MAETQHSEIVEVWKPHPLHALLVSNLGNLRNLDGSPKQAVAHNKGYPTVNVNGKTQRVHRLVLETFVGPCPEGMEACHNDGDPANACLSNLRWDTHSANMLDALKHGTIHRIGKTLSGVVLTAADVQAIRTKVRRGAKKGSDTSRAVAREFGISMKHVQAILRRRYWQ